MKPTEESLVWLSETLEHAYGRGGAYPVEPPLSGEPRTVLGTLIVTMLSQASNDEGTRKVYRALRHTYPQWGDVVEASLEDVVEVLRPGGLAEGKARNMRAALERIRGVFGDYTLDALFRWSDREVFLFLVDLPGVGPKTAACVLLFALGREAFSVDTHVARISRRLGLVPEKSTPEKIQSVLEPQIPTGHALQLHLNLLAHGRATCQARRPGCGGCILFSRCDRIGISEYGFGSKRGETAVEE